MWLSLSKIVYNLFLSILGSLISVSILVKYAASTYWHATSAKILLAEYLHILFILCFLIFFILLQISSRIASFKEIYQPMKSLQKDEKIYLFLVTILTIIGFYLRFINLNSQSFWVDETITSIAAKSIVYNGIPILSTGEIYDRSLLNIVIIALSFKIFGITEFAGRLPSVIFGTLFILIVYFLGKNIGNKNIGLFASLLVTFSLIDIIWSRQARMYSQLQFFFTLSILLFYLITVNKKHGYVPLFLVSTVASYLSHQFSAFLFLIFILFLILSNVTNIIKYLSNLCKKYKNYIVILLILIIFTSKFVYDNFYNLILLTAIPLEPKYTDFYLNYFLDTYPMFFYIFLFGTIIFLFYEIYPQKILLILIFIPLYIIIWHSPIAGANFSRAYNTRYILFFMPFFYIISTYFIYNIISINKMLSEKIKSVLCFVIIISLIILQPSAFTIQPKELYVFYEDINDLHQPDFRTAYTFIKNNMIPDDIIISDSTGTSQAVYYLNNKYRDNKTYNLYEKNLVFKIGDNLYDIYGNATIIENLSAFKEIVNSNKRGWVILELARGKTGLTYDYINSNMYKELVTTSMINTSSYQVPIKVRDIQVYSWGIVDIQKYSDDFETNKWSTDKDSSRGIDRSKGIIKTKYVLYPNDTDTQAYVKYHLNFSSITKETTIKVTGNRRHVNHNLSVWASPDNETYTKIVEFNRPVDITQQADITNYIDENQTWIEFRFFRSSKGENMPRILDFSITAVPKDNKTVKITPIRNEEKTVSSQKASRYNPINLIKEPSFEHYRDSNPPPIVWSFASGNSALPTIDTSASSGNYSFQISANNAGSGNAELSQLFVVNGSKYLFNISYKNSGSGNISALLLWMDAQGKETGKEQIDLSPSTAWSKSSSEKYIPPNTTQGRIILRYQTQKGDSGTVWYDDVRLYAARED